MSLRVLPDLEQRSDEWYAQRRGMVTASSVGSLLTTRPFGASEYACPDCGAVAGEPCTSKVKKDGATGAPIKTAHPARSEYARQREATSPLIVEPSIGDTAKALIATLAAERISRHTDLTFVSYDMQRGIDDEPRALEAYAKHYDVKVSTVGFMVRDDWGFELGYSPDGLVGDDGLIEVKSRKQKKHLQTVLLDSGVPAENMAQIQAGLLVSGRAWCDYVDYCGGMKLWVQRVHPDPRWHDAIVAAAAAFETQAERLISTYLERTASFPMTEWIDPDLEVI